MELYIDRQIHIYQFWNIVDLEFYLFSWDGTIYIGHQINIYPFWNVVDLEYPKPTNPKPTIDGWISWLHMVGWWWWWMTSMWSLSWMDLKSEEDQFLLLFFYFSICLFFNLYFVEMDWCDSSTSRTPKYQIMNEERYEIVHKFLNYILFGFISTL